MEHCVIGGLDTNSTPLLILHVLLVWGGHLIFLFGAYVYVGHAHIANQLLIGSFTHLGFRVCRVCDLQILTLHQLTAKGNSVALLTEVL